jgi:hypothetical protein
MKFKEILEFAKWDTPEERKKKKQHIKVENVEMNEKNINKIKVIKNDK